MVTEKKRIGCRSFTIENGALSLTVTEYGATALSLTRDGVELLLGFDSIRSYEKSGAFIGGIVGRWANRIGGAAFELGGRRYELCANEGRNCLHGGDDGKAWNKRLWSGRIVDDVSVCFTLCSPDGDNGFPGELTASVEYTLMPDRVRIDFSGMSNADTYFCPTSHIYFSLGEKNILGAEMQINASGHLEVDEGLIPTGRILPMTGDFDFNIPRPIGRDYDDCFILCDAPACTVRTNDITLQVFTDYPALQFYTGTYLDCGHAPNAGFAVEPQFFPDTPNKPDFPDALLKAGERFHKYVEYVVEVLSKE
ncbi:MAG: galactose mutarotase [Oscillospiraceae bacterium]|nr:galactose mutarotase [Oscillospiraceae bacterium]